MHSSSSGLCCGFFCCQNSEEEEWQQQQKQQQGGVAIAIAITMAMAMDLTRTLLFVRHSTNAHAVTGILAPKSASGAIFACTGLIPLRLDLERRVRRKSVQSGNKFSGKLVYSNQNGSVRAKIANTNSSSSSDPTSSTPKEQEKQKQSILDLPAAIWKQILGPLSNFGFGKRSVWEGGVGLFVMSGVVLLAITLVWVKGKQIRARTRKYEAIFEFQQAQGITVGTPVRIRGVDVGNVVQVRPSLERIDVVVELSDAGIVVPRNALVEVNQSGLISETLIDVTPRKPLPKPTVGPMDPKCAAEGLIVCDRERIKGEQGVSLDELVGICTKIARQVDALGVDRVVGMAERLGDAVQEARPLLAKVQSMAGDVEPLLKEVRDGGILKDFEKLTRIAAEAGSDFSKLNKGVLTSDNMELLRDSVSTLTKTLKHVESISKDVSGVTGDAKTRNNLKQLIESLSRLVTD